MLVLEVVIAGHPEDIIQKQIWKFSSERIGNGVAMVEMKKRRTEIQGLECPEEYSRKTVQEVSYWKGHLWAIFFNSSLQLHFQGTFLWTHSNDHSNDLGRALTAMPTLKRKLLYIQDLQNMLRSMQSSALMFSETLGTISTTPVCLCLTHM